MNCMTYDYRFSMLIHTEFEYRSRYLKKTAAIPDIHYETPLNSDIRAVLELEASNGVQGVQTRLKRKDRFESK